MYVEDEKDYVMRMIKQVVRALLSVILGKKYATQEAPIEDRVLVSGRMHDEYYAMVDAGEINEAENLILEDVDYSDKWQVAEIARFYEYLSDKDDAFLEQHDYSKAEVLDGLKRLADAVGYGVLTDVM